MSNDWKSGIRDGLLESYKPRISENTKCSICGSTGRELAFHAIEYYQECNGQSSLPESFVPSSEKNTGASVTVRGAFPVCIDCSPTCALCGLPRYSDTIVNYYRKTEKQLGERLTWGCGLCEHFHIIDFFKKLLGDETQLYLTAMKQKRDAEQKKINAVFDGMFGKK